MRKDDPVANRLVPTRSGHIWLRGENMRQLILSTALLCCLGTGPTQAADFEDAIVAQLSEQGFTGMSVHRTFLGRVIINAKSNTGEREIVINPNTGEILRDYFQASRTIADRSDRGGNGAGVAAGVAGGGEVEATGDVGITKSDPSDLGGGKIIDLGRLWRQIP